MAATRSSGSAAREVTGPRSLTRVLGLFDALAKARDGLTLAELNQALKSPKSSLLNLLRPLVQEGYLSCEAGRYRLGPSIFRLASNIMAVWNFSSTLRPYLEELAERSQESVYVGILDRAGKVITYTDAIESPHSVRFSVQVGAARPLYSTAAGRVLLAFVEHEWLEEYLRTTKLEAYTPNTIASRKALRSELDKIRATHFSVSMGETFPESAAVAAPVFGADGKIMAAIAIGAPVTRLQPRIDELRPIVTEIAARASGSTRGAAKSAAAAMSATLPAPPSIARASAASRSRAPAA